MDVLLVGSDTPAGIALQGAFAQWGRHNPMSLTLAASRWRSERQAKKAARRGEPGVVVDLRIASLLADRSSADTLTEADFERAHWLAKACERGGISYLFLSSDVAFAGAPLGSASRVLRESDEADAVDMPGRQLADTEQRILQASPSAIVLRTGPIFAPMTANLLTRILGAMADSEGASFDDQYIFCPVAYVDLARVVAAILDQISAGATAAGVFHYGSGDRTTEYGFAEAALAAASQYADCGSISLRATGAGNPDTARQRVLDCSRLRDAFAVKQVPWRGFINPTVKQFIEERALAGQA